MNCLWSDLAETELNKVAEYITDNFGIQSALEFLSKIEQWDAWLAENPEMARREPMLLSMRKHEYRSIIVKPHSKIILYVDSKGVHIVDLWDMRRAPARLVGRIRSQKE